MRISLPSLVFLLVAIAVPGFAQSGGDSVSSRAVVEGLVTKDQGSEPVKKALIELIAENQTTGGDYTAVTGQDGTFRIEDIVPGRYRLMVERTGFLEVEKHVPRSDGRIIALTAGQDLKDVVIRLQATAAVDGRVTDEDGDPLADAQVAVLRQTFVGGHIRWQQAGAEHANDLGEYRVAGLAPGRYYISVTPPPDFRSLIETASNAAAPGSEGAQAGGQTDGQACPPGTNCPTVKPAITSYITTYYPGVKDRAQAAPVRLQSGEDFPADFSLTPSPSVAIRGSVGDIPAGGSATVMLRARDFNSPVNVSEVRKDGSFEIRDVSPGTYTLVAIVISAAQAGLTARQTVEVAATDVTGLHLVPQPGGEIRGSLRLENKGWGTKSDYSQFFLALHSADGDDDMANALSAGDIFSNLAQVGADGGFKWTNVPLGRYFIVLTGDGNASPDWFLKSALAGGRNVSDAGLTITGGTVVLDLVASANGGVVDGVVTNHKGEPVSNATVVLVPEERFRSRTDRYRKTVADQSGRFVLHGIPPGSYTLLAWEDVDGDEYYNPEFLKSFEGQGISLRLAEGEHKGLQLEAVPAAEDQQ